MAAPDGDDPLSCFARFMKSEPVLDLARHWVGNSRLAFADCQATCYRPGHFLTTHDDGVAASSAWLPLSSTSPRAGGPSGAGC